MSYRVVWRRRLQNSLHVFRFGLLHDHADADELELALAEVNSLLAREPTAVGESREGEERVLIVHPLTVVFEVFDEAGVVVLYDLILYPRLRG